jgi:hypothetical protein
VGEGKLDHSWAELSLLVTVFVCPLLIVLLSRWGRLTKFQSIVGIYVGGMALSFLVPEPWRWNAWFFFADHRNHATAAGYAALSAGTILILSAFRHRAMLIGDVNHLPRGPEDLTYLNPPRVKAV